MDFQPDKEVNTFVRGCISVLKEPSGDVIEEVSSKTSGETETEKKKASIICRNCKNEITTIEHSIAVNGQHAHICKNPLGVIFHIGCFSEAWGCFIWGIPTNEATWFPGFTWSIAACSNCFTHLGWYYESGKKNFYGLIMANLANGMNIH
ncbi:MAG TPA: cereblon family protein [Syntrophales bacterium]|nr:cereblon family protein [Syntrophales bacterium]